jgi:hypothetical protein
MEPHLFTFLWPLLLQNLLHVSPSCVGTPFTSTSFLLFKLFGFQWQRSLECPNLLHWPHITSILLPSFIFLCLVGGSSSFRYSLAYSYFFHKWFQFPCVWTMCPSSSPLQLSKNMVVNLFKRKWLINYHLLDVKGILLISI